MAGRAEEWLSYPEAHQYALRPQIRAVSTRRYNILNLVKSVEIISMYKTPKNFGIGRQRNFHVFIRNASKNSEATLLIKSTSI